MVGIYYAKFICFILVRKYISSNLTVTYVTSRQNYAADTVLINKIDAAQHIIGVE